MDTIQTLVSEILTKREIEILKLTGGGYSNTQIGKLLEISQ